jgi:hypothetical protein
LSLTINSTVSAGLLGGHRNGGAVSGVAQRVLERDVEQLLHVMARELHRCAGMVRAVAQLLLFAVEDRLPERDAFFDHVCESR